MPHGRRIMAPVKDFGSVEGSQVDLNFEEWVWSSNYANTARAREVNDICDLR